MYVPTAYAVHYSVFAIETSRIYYHQALSLKIFRLSSTQYTRPNTFTVAIQKLVFNFFLLITYLKRCTAYMNLILALSQQTKIHISMSYPKRLAIFCIYLTH